MKKLWPGKSVHATAVSVTVLFGDPPSLRRRSCDGLTMTTPSSIFRGGLSRRLVRRSQAKAEAFRLRQHSGATSRVLAFLLRQGYGGQVRRREHYGGQGGEWNFEQEETKRRGKGIPEKRA